MKRALLIVGCLLLACPSQPNAANEEACKQAMDQLKAEKSAGTSCVAARGRAQAAFPSCKLVFLCKGEVK
jgi:hypothetical protein